MNDLSKPVVNNKLTEYLKRNTPKVNIQLNISIDPRKLLMCRAVAKPLIGAAE